MSCLEASTVARPQARATSQKLSWYVETFSDGEETDVPTDIGEGEITDDETDASQAISGQGHPAPHEHTRPGFVKVTREQRVHQIRRVVEEFRTLDFQAADALEKNSLVMRRLTLLKSF